jgi:superfamily II DNA or RNA helicase
MPDGTLNQPLQDVTLRPHQQELVDQVVNATPPARFLLSSPTGAGKAAALTASAGALRAKRGELRCLVIVPATLAAMWQDQLRRFGGLEAMVMTPQAYRRLQAETGGNVNVWSTVSYVVASIDFLKSDDRMDEVLSAKWDLVILDEVHRSTKSSQRGDVAEKIWSDSRIPIAAAATAVPNLPEWLALDARTTKVHWSLAALLKEGRVSQRRIHTISYTHSEAERQVAARVDDLVRQMPKHQSAQFTAQLLVRRLGSSMFALEQTLRRLLTVETFGDTDLNDWSADDIGEDADNTEVANSAQIDRPAGEHILALLEAEPSDTKWECCFQLLSSRGIGRTCSGIIFTDYADTAEYLEYLAKNRALNVFLLTGASTAEQRERALDQARNTPSLLIATGALEGMDIRFTNQVIHYDLPWNPRALEQRIGRVERVGSQFETFDHYYILEQSAAGDTLSSLMDKLRTIEDEWK